MSSHHTPISFVLWALALLSLPACHTTTLPPIGSQSESNTQRQTDEVRVWTQTQQAQRQIDSSGYLYPNIPLQEYINTISQRLIPPEHLKGRLAFQVRVLKNPLLNAFAYPHGAIYIHTGLLARMENEAQLAILLAHEMTHSTHRHALQSLRNLKTTRAIISSISLVGSPIGLSGLVGKLGNIGGMAAVTGYSRKFEDEADREGFALLVKAGYDPNEAPKLFQHLKTEIEQNNSKEPFFFGTHPRIQERINSFEDMVNESEELKGGIKNTEIFTEHIMPLLLDNAKLDLDSGRYQSAKNGLERYLEHHPTDSHAYYLLGELFRQRQGEQDWELAIAAYKQAVMYDPRSADPHKRLGVLYLKKKQHQQAKSELQRYLALSPNAKDKQFILQYLSNI